MCMVSRYFSLLRFPRKIHLSLTFSIVVPSEDSHQSEYIAPCDGRRG